MLVKHKHKGWKQKKGKGNKRWDHCIMNKNVTLYQRGFSMLIIWDALLKLVCIKKMWRFEREIVVSFLKGFIIIRKSL